MQLMQWFLFWCDQCNACCLAHDGSFARDALSVVVAMPESNMSLLLGSEFCPCCCCCSHQARAKAAAPARDFKAAILDKAAATGEGGVDVASLERCCWHDTISASVLCACTAAVSCRLHK